jgi:hypothetical protein
MLDTHDLVAIGVGILGLGGVIAGALLQRSHVSVSGVVFTLGFTLIIAAGTIAFAANAGSGGGPPGSTAGVAGTTFVRPTNSAPIGEKKDCVAAGVSANTCARSVDLDKYCSDKRRGAAQPPPGYPAESPQAALEWRCTDGRPISMEEVCAMEYPSIVTKAIYFDVNDPDSWRCQVI